MSETECTCGQSGIHFIDNPRCAANQQPETAPTPADVPGQGEVEGLARALGLHSADMSDERLIDGQWVYGACCDCGEFVPLDNSLGYVAHIAEVILASPWLAERDAEVARAERERVLGEVERRVLRITLYGEERYIAGARDASTKWLNILRDLRTEPRP